MKVYQDLEISGDREKLERFIAAIDEGLTDGWTRSEDLERESGLRAINPMYCFSCSKRDSRPACDLWIATRSSSTLYVSNIVPRDRPSLTYEQYNRVLQEFHDRFACPAADSLGVQLKLGNPDPRIEEFLSPLAVEALRSFSSHANRSILHPFDRERWNTFLTIAHHERATLSADMLQRWLVEEERWPEDTAHELMSEYNLGRELLKTYETYEAQHV